MNDSAILATGKASIKPTARGVRLWIEGAKLAKAGFARYDHYERSVSPDAIVYRRVEHNAKLAVAGRERNGKALPIIDYSAPSIDGYPVGTALTVEYRHGLVIFRKVSA